MTAASKRYMKRVSELPCVVRHTEGVHVHHPRVAGLTGMGQKCSDFFTFPLHPEEHAALHSNTPLWEMRNGSQMEHAAATVEKIFKSLGG